MNKQELQKAIEEAEANIKVWRKELEEPELKRWYPKMGKNFFFIHIDGEICGLIRHERSLLEIDPRNDYLMQSVFQTEEEARKERDRRLAEAELLDMCELDIRYAHASLAYNLLTGNFETSSTYKLGLSPYRFSSELACKEAIAKLGKEKLKLIFRIKDRKGITEETHAALSMLMGD